MNVIHDPHRLSETQRITLQMLANGYTRKEIALMRKISNHTVKQQCWMMFAKLGARNVQDAIAIGFREGIVQ